MRVVTSQFTCDPDMGNTRRLHDAMLQLNAASRSYNLKVRAPIGHSMCHVYTCICEIAIRRGFHAKFMPLETPFLSSWIRHCPLQPPYANLRRSTRFCILYTIKPLSSPTIFHVVASSVPGKDHDVYTRSIACCVLRFLCCPQWSVWHIQHSQWGRSLLAQNAWYALALIMPCHNNAVAYDRYSVWSLKWKSKVEVRNGSPKWKSEMDDPLQPPY